MRVQEHLASDEMGEEFRSGCGKSLAGRERRYIMKYTKCILLVPSVCSLTQLYIVYWETNSGGLTVRN